MKIEATPEWYEKMAEIEGTLEPEAGLPNDPDELLVHRAIQIGNLDGPLGELTSAYAKLVLLALASRYAAALNLPVRPPVDTA